MYTQCSKCVLGCVNGGQGLRHSKIPQPDFPISAARDKFSKTTSLHVDIRDPLLMVTPDLDHGRSWLEPLIENTNGSIAESSDKNVTGNLIRGQRRNART